MCLFKLKRIDTYYLDYHYQQSAKRLRPIFWIIWSKIKDRIEAHIDEYEHVEHLVPLKLTLWVLWAHIGVWRKLSVWTKDIYMRFL